jgi:hypothetical protein
LPDFLAYSAAQAAFFTFAPAGGYPTVHAPNDAE